MAKERSAADQELAAIGAILRALESLDGESIQRVLDYVFDRLSISTPSRYKSFPSVAAPSTASPSDPALSSRRISIRDLKEEKQPESSNQMAALIAYYLSDVADENERKDAVNTADLEKYFKQAGFRLPKSLAQTLPNAAAAGYFDPAGNGLYRLNPVGYNLVVHGLPRTHAPAKKTGKRTKQKLRR
jgi:hypothetical protein